MASVRFTTSFLGVLFLLCFSASALGETISPCGPDMEGMPTFQQGDDYSPFLCYRLSGLGRVQYTLKVWALETITPLPDLPFCAGPEDSLCERTVVIDNTDDKFRATREAWIVDKVQTFQYQEFHFVVRLFRNADQVAVYELYVPATDRRAPILNAIPRTEGTQAKQLTIQATARDVSEAGPITYSLWGAPKGMTINANTGFIRWTPSQDGNYTFVVTASQGADPLLFDSQLVRVNVKKLVGVPTPTPKPVVFARATLEEIEKDTGCLWYVTISLKNFEPGPISVIGRGALTQCSNGKAVSNYYWSDPDLITMPRGPSTTASFTFLQNDYGSYVYVFTDSKNKTSSVEFTVPAPTKAAVPSKAPVKAASKAPAKAPSKAKKP